MMSKKVLIPLLLLIFVTFIRFSLAFQNHATPAEAYVWLKGQQPDWGYVEGPPGTSLLAKEFTDFMGRDFGMALIGPLAGFLASIGLWLFVKRCTDSTIALLAVLALNTTPTFNTAATTTSSTALATAFGLFALAAFARIINGQKPILGWVFAGLMLGPGIYIDFAILWLAPTFLLFVSISQKHRIQFLRPGLYLFLAMVFFCIIPLWEWNKVHDNIWFAATTLGSTLAIPFNQSGLLFVKAFLGLSPLLACAMLGVVLYQLQKRTHLPLLLLASFPTLAWIFTSPLSNASSFLLLLASAPILCETSRFFYRTPSSLLKIGGILALVVALLFSGAWLWVRQPMDATAWKQAAEQIRDLTSQHFDTAQVPAFPIAATPELAATLAYYAQWDRTGAETWPPIFVRESAAMESQFSLWPRYDEFQQTDQPPDELFTEVSAKSPYLGRDAFYVTTETRDDLPTVIRSGFEVVAPFSVIEFKRRDKLPSRLEIYLCTNYQTVPL